MWFWPHFCDEAVNYWEPGCLWEMQKLDCSWLVGRSGCIHIVYVLISVFVFVGNAKVRLPDCSGWLVGCRDAELANRSRDDTNKELELDLINWGLHCKIHSGGKRQITASDQRCMKHRRYHLQSKDCLLHVIPVCD